KPSTFISQTSSANYPFFNADKGGTCQQAFTIIFTDGFYNGSDPGVGDADSDQSHLPYDGPPFADGSGNTLADVAMYYFERDLNTNLANNVPVTNVDPANHQHMVTFTIAFGVSGSIDTTLYPNCPLGACPDPWPGTGSDSGRIDDMFHAAVNGRGQFISASNNEELIAALEALGNDIDSRLGSAAALATNSIQRQVGSVIYQGTYNTANWYGDVSALPLDLTTGNVGAPLWQASDSVPAWGVRNILSYDGSAGVLFDAASLTAAQEALLDPDGAGPLTAGDIVDFIRGDTSKSVDNGGTFRNRNHPLGDVVQSAPIYFKGMVYIGANDGMLHGLDAATGEELFAYVPNLVYDHLSELADQAYSHKYYVDGTATVAKVGGRDVLVCGLGKGGKGYFALDVTDPTAMDPTDVLWEYSAEAANDPDLGYTFGRAFIVNTKAGQVVIFSNGYDSADGSAALYVLDPVTGAVLKKFVTGVTGCNGLATPAAVDVELDGYVDYVFAGDRKGNMWKFDLRDANQANWTFAYQESGTPKPLVTVKNKSGDIQPITSPPQVMLDCASDGDVRGLMVIFGTGQYLTTDDFINMPVQSYYGIWDRGPLIEDTDGLAVARTSYLGSFEADRSLSNMPGGITLLEQEFEVYGAEFSALTDRPADWYDPASGSGSHVGWYWDMPVANERMVRDPLLRGGHAILVSTVPSTSPCDSGGTSFINIVNACTGGRPYSAQFDVNKDNKITETDDKILDPYGNPIPPSRQERDKIVFTPLEVGDMLYLPDSEGGHGNMPVVPIRAGMFFWRVIGQ
ncbi:MAG: PilC/PilY family type IV pilus protein, partial [Desulfobacteraceae bacterium]|nr:PilC/PilY family type IV pilus protein [Desulfobacteraceae bacterium]